MVLVHLQPVVIVIVCHAIATDGGVGGALDHGLCLDRSFALTLEGLIRPHSMVATFHGGWVWLHISLCGRVLCMVVVHLQPVVIVIVCHAITTDGGVGGVLDHGLYLAWIHVSVSVLLGWWSGSHCVWIHPTVCLVVST